MVQKAPLEEAKEEVVQKTPTFEVPVRTSGLVTRASVKRDEETKGLLSHRGSTGDDLWQAKLDASKAKPYKLLHVEQKAYVTDYEDHLLKELSGDQDQMICRVKFGVIERTQLVSWV